MVKIIDEHQTDNWRLLMLDKEFLLKEQGQTVKINGKRFNVFSVHGIKKAIAIKMPKGFNVSFIGLTVEDTGG